MAVVSMEAFNRLRPPASIDRAAEEQVKLDMLNEQLQEKLGAINDKFDELQGEKKAYYEDMYNSLLRLHCGVDDSHVDYVNTWKRQYDAALDRLASAPPFGCARFQSLGWLWALGHLGGGDASDACACAPVCTCVMGCFTLYAELPGRVRAMWVQSQLCH